MRWRGEAECVHPDEGVCSYYLLTRMSALGPLSGSGAGSSFVPVLVAFVPALVAFVPALVAFVPALVAFVPVLVAFVPVLVAFVPVLVSVLIAFVRAVVAFVRLVLLGEARWEGGASDLVPASVQLGADLPPIVGVAVEATFGIEVVVPIHDDVHAKA
jgi:hypothetical protein